MKLRFIRQRQLADLVRAYRIFVDGKHIENIRFGQTKEMEITDGEHEVLLKIDWCCSNTIRLGSEAGEKTLKCYNTFAGWKIFTLIVPLYYTTFGRKHYLTLEDI
ncbi:MAG: hypothetical protein ABIK28_01010 [Planctomycetota bacterium]